MGAGARKGNYKERGQGRKGRKQCNPEGGIRTFEIKTMQAPARSIEQVKSRMEGMA